MKNKEYTLPVILSAGITAVICTVMFFINKLCGALCLAFGTALTAVFAYYMKKRIDNLRQLNDYLSLVCSGQYELDIADNSEGELSILKNNLYKVILLLRSQNETLNRDKAYLADSLADISHQLKTPLTSMMVIADLLKNEENSGKRKEFTGIIENQCERMRWLIGTLLKLSKLDAGTADFHFADQSICAVLEEGLKPFLIMLDLKSISLSQSVQDFTFLGDKNWTVEAVQNIIKNCIEHTPDGGRLTIFSESTNLYDELIIRDNGKGIDEADLPHIFERFYHGKNAAADSVGIGLALSKAVLQKERASVEVANDGGAVFKIKFYKAIV